MVATVLAVLFFMSTVVCAFEWFLTKTSLAGMFWYLDKKGYPFPTDEEMKRGTRWAAENMIKDVFQGKR